MGSKGDTDNRITAVIGAGASGCMAAVSAALAGGRVILLESNDRIGKKIYATGNGRCNLTNLRMEKECYHQGSEKDLSRFFARFNERDLIAFWESRGIYLHDRRGYVYPRTDQAATIAEGFAKILSQLGVEIRTGCPVESIKADKKEHKGSSFLIKVQGGQTLRADKVILCCGGMAGPQYGCTGDGYRFARAFGHTVCKPLPALVPLLSGDGRKLKAAAGVRCDAAVTLFCDGRKTCSERGELQITKEGISGIPVFQISGAASRNLDRGRSAEAHIDFIPDLEGQNWKEEIARRLSENRDCTLGEFFLGLVNRKVLDMVLAGRNLQAEKKARKLSDAELTGILTDLRDFRIEISGTGSFKQAQVTTGGIPLSETDDDLQSVHQPGLHLAGELLDVDGICGGYNLQWAMTSGWIAGGMRTLPDEARDKKQQGEF